MRGGQYVNQWRMAELHAKEAPDRVRELEAWGAVFDRTKDGRILQRHFGGHKYPRLAHGTHFAANIAIDAIWNLREHIRFLLSLHREGQRQFARKHAQTSEPTLDRKHQQKTTPRVVKPRERASPGQVA